MSRPDSPFLALFLLAGAAASVVGQQLAPPKEGAAAGATVAATAGAPAVTGVPVPTAVQLPGDRVLVDVPGNGTVQAATATWKTGFGANGATFVPFLGGDAPSAPATFRLHAVRSGEVPFGLGDAMPSLTGERVDYARGGVCERYVLRPAGVEQQFVFTDLPTRASLELDIVVETVLAHGVDARGHAFTGAHGGVCYGHALAIDANGRELPLTTTWTGSALRITVPAAFLAGAALPLLVDPLIAPIVNHPGTVTSAPLAATDIAHHQESGLHFVSYERAYSPTDHDVYVVVLDAQMQQVGVTVIDISSEYWTGPRIAVLEAHDLARVVAQASAGGVAPHSVKSRSFPCVASPTVGPVDALSTGAGNQNYRAPDIGGDTNPVGPTNFLVAYEDLNAGNASNTVCYRLSATGVSTYAHSIVNGVAFARRVAVSKTCGSTGGGSEAWALVWRAETTGSTDGKLRASFVTRGGQLVVMPSGNPHTVDLGSFTPNAGSEWDVSSPTDHDRGRVFLVAETRVNTITGRGSIFGLAIDRAGIAVANETQLVAGTVDRRSPAVDCDGTRYALAHASVYTPADSDVRINTVAVDGGVLEVQGFATVSTAFDGDRSPAICARHDVAANRFALAWTHDANGVWSVQTAGFDGVGAGGFATRATGCSAMTIAATGRPALGETFTITLANGSGLQGFLVGAPVSIAVPACAGCIVGADQTLLLGSQLVVPVPGDPSLVGAILACQGLQLVGSGGPCLGLFELTNTIDVTIQ